MSQDRVDRVDALVTSGAYPTRAELVRAAVDDLLLREEEASIDRAIVEGYTRIPQTAEELEWADWSTVDSIEDEPW